VLRTVVESSSSFSTDALQLCGKSRLEFARLSEISRFLCEQGARLFGIREAEIRFRLHLCCLEAVISPRIPVLGKSPHPIGYCYPLAASAMSDERSVGQASDV
jgi:hypothetical protein